MRMRSMHHAIQQGNGASVKGTAPIGYWFGSVDLPLDCLQIKSCICCNNEIIRSRQELQALEFKNNATASQE